MTELTPTEKRILDATVKFIKRNGTEPKATQIEEILKMHRSNFAVYFNSLLEKGVLKKIEKHKGSPTITNAKET